MVKRIPLEKLPKSFALGEGGRGEVSSFDFVLKLRYWVWNYGHACLTKTSLVTNSVQL